MANENPTPTPDDNNNKPKRKRSVQNQAIGAYITDSLATLNTALQNPEIAAKLIDPGYTAAAIQEGIVLQAAAREAFNKQLPGIGADRSHTSLRKQAIADAREDYTDFRGIARAAFPGQGDRVALGVTGDMPDDFGKFVAAAGASYAAGKKAPHTAKLTLRGYTPARLDTLIVALGKLTEPDLGEEEPDPAPEPDEPEDDLSDLQAVTTTYNALKEWMKEFKGIARVTLRKRPDLLREMGL
ncbi:MAG: hypothetical protein ABIT76_13405 [Chthoniobacterales bacterium]